MLHYQSLEHWVVSFPKVRPVKNRKQGKVLLILNGRKNEKDPIYRDSNCNHVEAT